MFSNNTAVESKRDSDKVISPQIIVIGLGNPILGDDGIGWLVAEEVKQYLNENKRFSDNIEVKCFALGGLSLMEQMMGFDRAIIIDALQMGQGDVGQIYHFSLNELPDLSSGHMTAAHDTSLQTALRLGREMGAELPYQVDIVGIEAEQVYEFSDSVSPAVAAAIPSAVQTVIQVLIDYDSPGF